MPLTIDQQRSVDYIVNSITTGKVIPIVGYDMLYNEHDTENAEKDFLKMLIKKHAENDSDEFKKTIFENEKDLSGSELINSYYHNMPPIAQRTFKVVLSKTIKKERINWPLVPESFRKLVSIKRLNFFINCTFTNSLALAFNSCRAVGDNQVDLNSSYDVLNYRPGQPEPISKLASDRNFRAILDKPLIYNLFGTHDDIESDYVLTDADYIELIYDMIENRELKFTNLISYLKNADLLFLGCNFQDWFFRFFIRVCVGNRLEYDKTDRMKTVIDSLIGSDLSRSVFIKNYEISTIDIPCNTLIDEIYKSFKKDPNELSCQKNNRVFISYCCADKQVATDIAMQFDEKFIDYFLDDNDLEGGNNLNTEVTGAIDKCCIFLPIISSNVQKAKPYVWKEWSYAISRSAVIWPVFKEEVDKDMLLPAEYYVTYELRDKILHNKNILGVSLETGENRDEMEKRGNLIPEKKLLEIKNKQYDTQVYGQNKKQEQQHYVR